MRDERRNNMRYNKRPLYDIEEILDNVTGREVAEYFGLDIVHRGAYDFIHCPGHFERLGKEDTRANNCILTEYGYHCSHKPIHQMNTCQLRTYLYQSVIVCSEDIQSLAISRSACKAQ